MPDVLDHLTDAEMRELKVYADQHGMDPADAFKKAAFARIKERLETTKRNGDVRTFKSLKNT